MLAYSQAKSILQSSRFTGGQKAAPIRFIAAYAQAHVRPFSLTASPIVFPVNGYKDVWPGPAPVEELHLSNFNGILREILPQRAEF
jgi:hypothetical protein